jgi:oligoendopeptidase F
MTQAIPKRSEIPVEFTWDLSSVYPNDTAWSEEFAKVEASIPEVAAGKGTIHQGPAQLLHLLIKADDLNQRLWQLHVYAGRRRDADLTDPVALTLSEKIASLAAKVGAAASFFEPELLELPQAMLHQWIEQEPKLKLYELFFSRLYQQKQHIRSAEVEEVLAQLGEITRAPVDIFETLTDADFIFPEIQDEEGKTVTLSQGRYGRYLESRDPRVRRDAFQNFYKTFKAFKNTLATTLSAQVRAHVVEARIRGYQSCLEAALAPNEIPVEVYHNLLSTIHEHLPALHRYMALKKQILGLEEMHVYDIYAPLIPEVDLKMPYQEACQKVKEALAPLGPGYAEGLDQMFSRRWIDVYESAGKQSGAYSDGSYTTPPFILLNYQDRLEDSFTLAHELGHSLHSYFTRKGQPFVYGNYTIFVAEVASTVNESLYTSHLLKSTTDDALRRHLLIQRLEDIRTTIFRQSQFAEFEKDIHEAVEAGEALTADFLSERCLAINKKYYGPAITCDEEIAVEWARIPHFYYNFYVYQYATGLSAALALSSQILEEGAPAQERYLKFLSGGSSKTPIELLRGAGVDMQTPAPIQAAMKTFSRLLDELEKTL